MTTAEETNNVDPRSKRGEQLEKVRLDRDYRGRKGWSFGATWDSLKYSGRLLTGAVSRRLARRKVLKKLEAQKTFFDERLVELGRFALYLDGFEPGSIQEFQEELEKLEQRQESLEQQIKETKERFKKVKLDASKVQRELEESYQDARMARRDVEEELDPLIAEHRTVRSKLQRCEWEIEHLDEKVRLGDGDLNRLSREGAPVAEVSKLRTKVSKWKGEIKKTERKMPELRSRIQSVKPEIKELKVRLEEAQKAEEAAKAKLREASATEKARQEELITEKDKLDHDLSEIQKFKNRVFKECGEVIHWNRIEDPALEGRYGELDAIEKEEKRLDAKATALNKPKGKLSWEPLFRTGVVFTALLLVMLIILKLTVM